MGVIALSDHEVWKIARHEFHRLLDSAGSFLEEGEDLRAVEEAKALDGLHLDINDDDQAGRLCTALLTAANQLSLEIQGAPDMDARDEQFVVRLDELRGLLERKPSSDENI